MKKILTFIACLFFGATMFCNAADREHTLKIYNWADYIDEDLLEEFKSWYKDQTGEDVEIIYQLFDVNEVMLSKIELGHEDFDVVCSILICFFRLTAISATFLIIRSTYRRL